MVRIFSGMSSSRSGTPTSRSPSPPSAAGGLQARNLKLRVRCGPTYDPSTHCAVNVNDGSRPTIIDSENFIGSVLVRVRDYIGVPGKNGLISVDEEYFSETKDTCSILFGGW